MSKIVRFRDPFCSDSNGFVYVGLLGLVSKFFFLKKIQWAIVGGKGNMAFEMIRKEKNYGV